MDRGRRKWLSKERNYTCVYLFNCHPSNCHVLDNRKIAFLIILVVAGELHFRCFFNCWHFYVYSISHTVLSCFNSLLANLNDLIASFNAEHADMAVIGVNAKFAGKPLVSAPALHLSAFPDRIERGMCPRFCDPKFLIGQPAKCIGGAWVTAYVCTARWAQIKEFFMQVWAMRINGGARHQCGRSFAVIAHDLAHALLSSASTYSQHESSSWLLGLPGCVHDPQGGLI